MVNTLKETQLFPLHFRRGGIESSVFSELIVYLMNLIVEGHSVNKIIFS